MHLWIASDSLGRPMFWSSEESLVLEFAYVFGCTVVVIEVEDVVPATWG